MELTKRIEVISGITLVAIIAAGCLLVIWPFTSSILWAAVICFATWPLHQRINRLCKNRRSLSAALMTLIMVVVTVLPFVLVATALDTSLSSLIARLQNMSTQGIPPAPAWTGHIPLVGSYLQSNWSDLATDSEKGHTFLKVALANLKPWLLRRCLDFGIGVLHLCISVFIAFFFYRDGDRLVGHLSKLGLRILGDYSRHLVNVIGSTVRGVVYGFLGTALVQGVLAAIGFLIAGVPSALMLGFFTFFMALLPFGTPLIWIPVTVWLFVTSGVKWGLFMAAWGLCIVSGIDHPLRPYLISREANLPFVLVFLGAAGGLLAFGFIGLFLGPTLLAVGYCLVQEMIRHKKSPQHEGRNNPDADLRASF